MTSSLPFLRFYQEDSLLAWRNGRHITCGMFLSDVAHLASELPEAPYVINLCEDRYFFLMGFAAALLRGQISLLPQNRAPKSLKQVGDQYPGSYYLADKGNAPDETNIIDVRLLMGSNIPTHASPLAETPAFPGEQVAAIVFTSGSTGEPHANSKAWGSMVAIAQKTAQRLGIASAQGSGHIVATVPQQHMYGLETSVILPIQHGLTLHTGRPFFPEDIRAALQEVPAPRILVTTPVHLRACVTEQSCFPELACIVSATAPLPLALANQTERLFNTSVHEIYGWSEAGSVASRRPCENQTWRVLDGLSLHPSSEGHRLQAPYFPETVLLDDIIALHNDHEFTIIGRNTDLVNIAGKRTSLGDLNQKLNEIDGVHDGVFLLPPGPEEEVTRPIAFVVAPGKTKEEILTALRESIDPVFLPRPLYMVNSLLRNEVGKLPKEYLLNMIATETSRLNAMKTG